MGDSVIEELTIQPDDTLLGVTVSVLVDGRIRIETDEEQWTLPLSDSRAIATAALFAMSARDMSDLVAFLLARLAEDEQTLSALPSWALTGIESAAGYEMREYIERGLKDIAAKRRILAKHAIEHPGCATLKLLALPYSSHPDYREEWLLT